MEGTMRPCLIAILCACVPLTGCVGSYKKIQQSRKRKQLLAAQDAERAETIQIIPQTRIDHLANLVYQEHKHKGNPQRTNRPLPADYHPDDWMPELGTVDEIFFKIESLYIKAWPLVHQVVKRSRDQHAQVVASKVNQRGSRPTAYSGVLPPLKDELERIKLIDHGALRAGRPSAREARYAAISHREGERSIRVWNRAEALLRIAAEESSHLIEVYGNERLYLSDDAPRVDELKLQRPLKETTYGVPATADGGAVEGEELESAVGDAAAEGVAPSPFSEEPRGRNLHEVALLLEKNAREAWLASAIRTPEDLERAYSRLGKAITYFHMQTRPGYEKLRPGEGYTPERIKLLPDALRKVVMAQREDEGIVQGNRLTTEMHYWPDTFSSIGATTGAPRPKSRTRRPRVE
jgi:hypothetical protein